MARIIKQAEAPVKTKPQVNDQVQFRTWVPLQNIGSTSKIISGKVIKVNRVTVDVIDSNKDVWRVEMDELV
jgi:hypothetical protein